MGYRRNGACAALVAMGLAFGATTVAAQDMIGEIVATIDGEAREWRALGPDGSGTDYNTYLEVFGPMQSVSITGFPPGQVTTRGTLQITFTAMSGETGTFDQEVIYAPDGMRGMWTSLEGEDLITLEDFEATGAGGVVSGRVSGRLCLKESLFAEPDPDRCMGIEGQFNSSLPPASD